MYYIYVCELLVVTDIHWHDNISMFWLNLIDLAFVLMEPIIKDTQHWGHNPYIEDTQYRQHNPYIEDTQYWGHNPYIEDTTPILRTSNIEDTTPILRTPNIEDTTLYWGHPILRTQPLYWGHPILRTISKVTLYIGFIINVTKFPKLQKKRTDYWTTISTCYNLYINKDCSMY